MNKIIKIVEEVKKALHPGCIRVTTPEWHISQRKYTDVATILLRLEKANDTVALDMEDVAKKIYAALDATEATEIKVEKVSDADVKFIKIDFTVMIVD